MTTHMTTDAQTQAIPRVPTPVVAVHEHEIAASDLETDVARTESLQEMYEAGLANLEVLHDRWAAAMAELREAQPSGGRGEAAA
jgi:hypothetical protein